MVERAAQIWYRRPLAALWILGGSTLRAAFIRSAATAPEAPPLWPRLAIHLMCFAAFFALTTVVFGSDPPPQGPPEVWIILWLLGGAGTLLSLLPVAARGLSLLPLLRELAVPLGLASLLGLVA
jgi:peptidoglycan/LPS O-acetylase OafA/YrhL